MGDKVDITEVIEFSTDLETTATDLKVSLGQTAESIDKLIAMQSFSGKTASAAKAYFNEVHQTLLKSFENLFATLDEHVKDHLNAFQSGVDSSEFAMIKSDYLKHTEKIVKDDYGSLSEEQDSIDEIIANVSDISSVNAPSMMFFKRDYESAIEVITALKEDLETYTGRERQGVSELEELLYHIESIISNAGAVPGDSRFSNYNNNNMSVSFLALQGYNAKIHKDVIEEARGAKDVATKEMDESSIAIANKALKDLEDGIIDEAEYYAHLDELWKLQNDSDADGEVSKNFVQYVMDNFDEVTDNVGDNTIAAYLKQNFSDGGNNKLNRAELVKAMNANRPSSTYFDLKKSGNNTLTAGRAVTGSLAFVTIGVGTYMDYTYTDKTKGEAFTKNAAAGGSGALGMGITSSAVVGTAGVLGASTPIGWAVLGGIAVGTGATWAFNYAYDNNLGGIQDGLDWAGQQIDEVFDWKDE